jgi:hypothetical protein
MGNPGKRYKVQKGLDQKFYELQELLQLELRGKGLDCMFTLEAISVLFKREVEIRKIIADTPRKYQKLWLRFGRFLPNPQHAGFLKKIPSKLRRARVRFKPVKGADPRLSLTDRIRALFKKVKKAVDNQYVGKELAVDAATASKALVYLHSRSELVREPVEERQHKGPVFEYKVQKEAQA